MNEEPVQEVRAHRGAAQSYLGPLWRVVWMTLAMALVLAGLLAMSLYFLATSGRP
jgi:hypothetical protein